MVSLGDDFHWERSARIESRLRFLRDDLSAVACKASEAMGLEESVQVEEYLSYIFDYLNAITGDVERIQELIDGHNASVEAEDVGDDYQPPLQTYPAPTITVAPPLGFTPMSTEDREEFVANFPDR